MIIKTNVLNEVISKEEIFVDNIVIRPQDNKVEVRTIKVKKNENEEVISTLSDRIIEIDLDKSGIDLANFKATLISKYEGNVV